jgi:excinuclease ABC subunit A
MSFLPSALVPCERCAGRRFNDQTEAVRLLGASPGELLEMDIADVARLLASFPKVRARLDLLVDLGLGYLKLGQPSNTLSGGKAQRLKLATELALGTGGATLYVMDEPTTGLHRDDVVRVLAVIDRLVERGDTVVVIEHHPDVMLAADLIVDLGPEGGSGGGRIVARGTPEAVMKVKRSHTGAVLRGLLAAGGESRT